MKDVFISKGRWIGCGLGAIVLVLGVSSFQRDIPADQVAQKYATTSSKFVRISRMNVHYRDEGGGPVIILVHGSNCSLQSWEGWQKYLQKKFRVVSVDLPGHGLTGPNPNGNYDYLTMVSFLDDFANALHVDRFSIAGNSMGGGVALNYTILHPARVEKLILVDSLGYPDEIPPLTLRMWGYPVLGHVLTVFTPRFVYAQTIKDIYGHKERVTDQLIDRYYELLLREGNREATRVRFATPLQDGDLSRLKSIHVPTLVMWGGKDPWFKTEFAVRFAHDLPGARLRLYPDLGHVPMEEAPEVTAPDAASFLDGAVDSLPTTLNIKENI